MRCSGFLLPSLHLSVVLYSRERCVLEPSQGLRVRRFIPSAMYEKREMDGVVSSRFAIEKIVSLRVYPRIGNNNRDSMIPWYI
ncbi:hypothetical protein F5B21DRAFT_483442 [Xylaria acuta]|nr:hypothetical protein F5B21DRAFT_483442 [Xylaria acuta]